MKYLLVVDVQEDYTGAQRDKQRYPYDVDALLINVNKKIAMYPNDNVIYIKNRFFFERQNKDKELNRRLKVVSNYIFTKNRTSIFTNKDFRKFISDKSITELEIVGVDGNYCVKAAVIGAVKAGYNVNLDEECIGTGNSKKYKKTKNIFQKLGVTFL